MIDILPLTRWRWASWMAAAFLVLICAGWLPSVSGKNEDHRVARWIRIDPQVIERRMGLAGRIEAARQIVLSAPFDGTVTQVLYREGQKIRKGEVLLELDTLQLDIQIRQALSEVLKAKRALQDLQQWQHGPEVSRARRVVSIARLTLADTESKLEDTRALFKRGIVARAEVDTLAQQAGLQRLELSAAQAELRAISEMDSSEYMQIAEMELESAQVRHQSLLRLHSGWRLIAPFDGVVVAPPTIDRARPQLVRPGSAVFSGMPLFGLTSHESFRAVALVNEADLRLLREGMVVEVTGEGFAGDRLVGRVDSIGMQARNLEETGGAVYEVSVLLEEAEAGRRMGIRSGMTARLAVVAYRNAEGFAVPAEALIAKADGGYAVRYREDTEAPAVDVTVSLGATVSQGIEITGVKAGYVELNARE